MTFPGSLHCHTHYSNVRLRDCIIKETELIDTAISLGHQVVAMTDHECLSGHLKALSHYYKVKEKNPNFKLILGNEIYLCRNSLSAENFVTGEDSYYHFILLAKDSEGHKQLRELSSRAWLRSYITKNMRRVPTYYQDLIDIIDNNKGHVIASTACLGGLLASECLKLAEQWDETKAEKIKLWCRQMVRLFGKDNFYIEIQPPAEKGNEQWLANKILLDFAHELDIPWIVTTDAHYARLEDREIHKAYLNSQNGEREVDAFYATTYMMNTKELESYFEYSLEEGYRNIETIANQCEDYDLRRPLKIPQLPWKQFNPMTNVNNWIEKIPMLDKFINSYYIGDRQLVYAIVERLEQDETLQNEETYAAIDECLDMTWVSSEVNKTHWSAYYLNLQKIIDTCWEAGSLVGPGRGSGVGFILLYILGITQINPLREATPTFAWRFLNPSRVSVLDVDFDIEGGRREQVLTKLREIYGQDRISNVITFGTEKSKSAILTAARGLGIDVDEGQFISSLIPSDRGITRTLHQCYYGDEDEGFSPIRPFVQAMNERPKLWEVAQRIEGVICRIGVHAGGVIFVDEPFENSTSLMRAPDGTIVTAYELHDAEVVSLIKYDILSVEALDKVHNCLDLLIKYKHITAEASLKETYEKYLGIYNIERNDPKMWEMVHDHKILSLFQMEKQSGVQGIALSKPSNVEDLATLNSVIRLMASEKGAEQPLHKFARFRNNIKEWYKEMDDYGLTKEEQSILEPILLPSSGMCEAQETFMRLVQMPECGGFDLGWADRLRKSIAKKKPEEYNQLTKEYFANAKEKGLSENLCNYVWNVLVATSRGYGFNKSHTLAYSLVALQEMNLAYRFPTIYWNTACLISDSGGAEGTTDYTKMAQSVNKIRREGVQISLVNINHSTFGFEPDEKNNRILFGMKALININDDIVNKIIDNRPYKSLEDFYARISPKRQEMISLIKGGAFNEFHSQQEAMVRYLWLSCDKKKRITLQNMGGLIKYNLLPQGENYDMARRVYEFNRYLKAECKYDNVYYKLDDRAMNFICELQNENIINELPLLEIKKWDKTYQSWMDLFRAWIAENKAQILHDLNIAIFMEDWNKYAAGNVSAWEMEAMCFYYHEHELMNVNKSKYGLADFSSLSETPIIDRIYHKGSTSIPIYKLFQICGTCIAKDKNKSTVFLLTTDGSVVPIKLRKEHFSLFDKQISQKQADGTKKVLEKSWFNRGNMIMVQGIRRGDEFATKRYASSTNHQLYHIDSIDEKGNLELRHTRLTGDIEEDE